MQTLHNKEYHFTVRCKKNVATIFIDGDFEFYSYREFTSAYKTLLEDSIVNTIEIDLSGVQHLDSSALGMLLILADRIKKVGKKLLLLRPSPIVKGAFDLSNFYSIFSIRFT